MISKLHKIVGGRVFKDLMQKARKDFYLFFQFF